MADSIGTAPSVNVAAACHQDLPADKLPRHVALIMDGNGRWARRRGYLRLRGHEKGAVALREITKYCRSIGIAELTVFALSTENFRRRPLDEVRFLTKLLKSYVISERRELLENNIRLKTIGLTAAFPEEVRLELAETERLTAGQTGMILRLALNYGSRQEILDAVHGIVRDVLSGRLTLDQVKALGELGFRRYLNDPEMSDPDLLIRTGGDCRLSNFLLWQCSYTEIWVTQDLWPDLGVERFKEALRDYCSRVRKYGAILPQVESSPPPLEVLEPRLGSRHGPMVE